MDKKACTVYIDESGDLGANHNGTQWFVLSAIVVDKSDEPAIRYVIKSIKQRLNLQTIHFRNLKDFNRRSFVVQELSNCNFTCVNVLFDTFQMDKTKMPTDLIAYNYICRYLVERVSWYLRDTGRTGEIVLSSRGTGRDAELMSYIKEKLIPYEGNEIANVFTGVDCKPASAWDMLQLADVCATSMFYSHEINGYGFTVPCYAKKLSDKIYRHSGKVDRYGIKYFNDDMKPASGLLKSKRPCIKA